jgi:tol-pal system protein YbgF
VRIPRITSFAALLPLLWVVGCATQADIQAVQKERDVLRAQTADTRASLDSLRREIESVRGEVEEVRHRLDLVARERGGTSPQVKLLEDRLAALERQVSARSVEAASPPVIGEPSRFEVEEPPAVASPSVPPQTPPPSGPRPGPATAPGGSAEETALAKEPLEAQDEYKLALRALRDQQYDKAIQQFRTFQRKYASSEMADDAQYWIGESYFLQRDYNRAILEFNDVLKYRRGDKVPAALLRQAQAFLEIGDKTDARLILQKLINDHPNSEQAREARDRLQNLGR